MILASKSSLPKKTSPPRQPNETQYINRIIAGFRLTRLPGSLTSAAKGIFRVLKLPQGASVLFMLITFRRALRPADVLD